jgi:hypothetical protein
MGNKNPPMTRNDAVDRAAALNAEHPDRGRCGPWAAPG